MIKQPRHRLATSRSTRLAKSLTLVALLATTSFVMTGFSSAAFTSQSVNSPGTVSAAADWTPPTVAMQSPGSSVRGTATLTATASDNESGIKNVAIQYQAAEGAAWTTVCTVSAAPYSCSWNTTAVADGAYDLRAIATDNAAYSTTSSTVRTTVANKLTVVLADPGEVIKGSVSLTTNVYGSGLLTTYTTRVEYAPSGTTSWKTACSNLVAGLGDAARSCTWDTTRVASGSYDLRSVVIVTGGSTVYSAIEADVMVDNTAPTVVMNDPGTPLNGTRTFSATASDDDSGVDKVVIEYAPTASSTWRTLCTITEAPYSCRYDTTSLSNGVYSFRAIATDGAGTSTTSAVVANRTVDNTAASVSVEDPGPYLTGTVTISASANAVAGVTSVRIQRAPAGTASWTDICTDASAPYSCAFDTTAVADGSYDLRAVLLDASGKTTISATVSGRIVDNSPVRAIDIQATNGGGTAGKLDGGDQLSYTYSERISTTSVLAGWNGSATQVSLRLRDGNLLGLGSSGDTVDIFSGTSNVNLGSVVLNRDFIKKNKTATFNATMTATTVTVSGVERTVVTVQLGSLTSGSGVKTVSSTGTMKWTPSAAATDLSGQTCSTAPATESGTVDRDF